jgi:tRNA modification GTPase
MPRSFVKPEAPPARDLIAALATPAGPGAIGVVRLSGGGVLDCLGRVLERAGRLIERPRAMVWDRVLAPGSGRAVDQVLAVFFPGPRSFTGEDSAEIHCHGGPAVPRLVLSAVLAAGARLARPGEFTERAFLNGRIGLDQAEAVAELVAAQSEAEAALAARHLEGALGRRLGPMAERLTGLRADLAAALDFFEDEWTEADRLGALSRLESLAAELSAVAALGREGRIYRDGLRVVLTGAPNVGKSSLLNALLGRDRAMVSERPGTTRDYLEAAVEWSGLRVELVDTAGLGGAEGGELEKMGRDLALRELSRADLALWLVDLSNPAAERPPEDLARSLGKRLAVVGSKADLAGTGDLGLLAVSSVTGQGLGALKEAILALAGAEEGPAPEVVPNLRQNQALEDCLKSLEAASAALAADEALDIAALELDEAASRLGLVTGAVLTEDLLEAVFSRFCLGK